VGARNAQEWITHFGFEAEKHPAYLTMALGAGSVTPMQMATGYSVFANGGYRIQPFLITKITDQRGKVLVQSEAPDITEEQRAIPARNAFTMTSLLQEVTRSGTAARAQATLKRPDVYGKTGTTNDAMDAWFAGYQPSLAAIVWIGYDTPRKLGDRETGGGLSLPIWIKFMETALRGIPVQEPTAPEGLIQAGGEWYYAEHGASGGVRNLGGNNPAGKSESDAPAALPKADERSRIIDLFRN
jgi:penicillin-binding protein 1A